MKGQKINPEMNFFSRLGFGSFVDKVVMPYVSTVPRKLQVTYCFFVIDLFIYIKINSHTKI